MRNLFDKCRTEDTRFGKYQTEQSDCFVGRVLASRARPVMYRGRSPGRGAER